MIEYFQFDSLRGNMRQVAMFRAVLLFLLITAAAFAQRDLATILGTVTDPQGGVVPNAKVTITEDATGVSYDVTTNEAGEYIRPAMKPGVYVNFTSADESQPLSQDYNASLERLRAVKRAHGPENFFRLNQNIRPWKRFPHSALSRL